MIAIALLLVATPAGAARSPEAIWRSSCVYCHQGSKVGPPVPKGVDATTLTLFVRKGAGAMPPFHPSEISDAELARLAAWLAAGSQH